MLPGVEDILSCAHERQSDPINAVLDTELKGYLVLLGQYWVIYGHTGQVHPFVRRHNPGRLDDGIDSGRAGCSDGQPDRPVGDEDVMARRDVPECPRLGKWQHAWFVGFMLRDQADSVTGVQKHGLIQSTEAQLDTAKVLKDCHRPIVFLAKTPDVVDHFGVFVQRAMGEVQPGAVYALANELVQHLGVSGGRADRDHDLCFAHKGCLIR